MIALTKIDFTDTYTKWQFTGRPGMPANELALLIQYRDAINILFEHINNTKTQVDSVVNPLLYMMRHTLELGYKFNLRFLKDKFAIDLPKNTLKSHDLSVLHARFKEAFEATVRTLKIDSDTTDQFDKHYRHATELIKELGPTEASTFRYVTDIGGKRIFYISATKDLLLLKRHYDQTLIILIHTVDTLCSI